jgi:putative PIN family toxin of toxin-antitoxin system
VKAVLDTVVFVRALINPKGRWGRLLFELSDRYVIVLSPQIIEEILTVVYRPELRRRLPQMAEPTNVARVLALLEQAEVLEPSTKVSVCRDSHDDKFFECAIEASADYIVSEDRDVLDVGEYEGIKTVDAAEFIQLISSP